jgi:DNA-binding CsgD family transcriptional regulator
VLHRDAGRYGSAASAAARAEQYAAACEDPHLPTALGARGTEQLTEREQEIAAFAAAGHASKEIASALRISVRTVDTHLGRVYRKLGVDGRAGLADVFGR